MKLALKEAQKAFQKGEFPVGCVIVQNGVVVSSGSREGTSGTGGRFNETDHAEMVCLKNAEKSGGGFIPGKAAIYSTMEPCLMCFGSILVYGIRRVVFALEDPMGGATGLNLDCFPPLYRKRKIEIIPGVMRRESLALFYSFFKKDENLYLKKSLLAKYTLDQAESCL